MPDMRSIERYEHGKSEPVKKSLEELERMGEDT